MECMRCGAVLGREDHCPACGTDVKLYKKILCTSNRYYNEGLKQAKARDLSGAVISLKKSLKFYKMNLAARNLLGLVYFEMGETVDAISEWVISRSLAPEDKLAEKYLSAVQSNGNKLEALNQTIKKYNQALLYCRQDSKDLAAIQLKKVLSLNPRLVKGHQLLALLYMEEGKYEQAKKALLSAQRIDGGNLTTFRYLQEADAHLGTDSGSKKEERKGRKEREDLVAYRSGNETIIRPVEVKDRSALGIILNIIVGIVIGALITWFLIVPSMRQNAAGETNQAVREANDTISTKNQTIKTLEEQLAELKEQVKKAEKEKGQAEESLAVYEQLLAAYDLYAHQDLEGAGTALEGIDADSLTGTASQIYQNMTTQVDEQYIITMYQEGDAAYKSYNYEEAAEKLQKVVDVDPGYGEGYAVYYLAQSYRRLEQNDQAAIYFQKVVELLPGTQRARTAEQFLAEYQAAQGQ